LIYRKNSKGAIIRPDKPGAAPASCYLQHEQVIPGRCPSVDFCNQLEAGQSRLRSGRGETFDGEQLSFLEQKTRLPLLR
jgi:hypothetical protein